MLTFSLYQHHKVLLDSVQRVPVTRIELRLVCTTRTLLKLFENVYFSQIMIIDQQTQNIINVCAFKFDCALDYHDEYDDLTLIAALLTKILIADTIDFATR